MNARRLRVGGLACLIVVVWLDGDRVGGQTRAATAAQPWTISRTPDGRPDLQGVWNFGTATPLERPADLADKAFLTPEEAVRFEEQQAAGRNTDIRGATPQRDLAVAYNSFWYEYGGKVVGTRRTSLITDPDNGKLPPLTSEGEQRQLARVEAGRRPPGGPEDFSLSDRCIVGFNAGPPMIPGPYNNHVQLIQSRDYVVIHTEMIHRSRMVPLDGRPPLASAIRQPGGVSRGRWEGDTLVVETANFTSKGASLLMLRVATDDNLRVVERFTRTGAETLLYEFTVDDPSVWTKPWSGALPMGRTDERIFEYACHEGNYAVANMLAGARAAEKKAGDGGGR